MEKKNKEQSGISKQIKVLIIGGIVLFFGAYFIYTLNKLGIFKSKQPQANTVISKNVLFELPKLYLFDETLYLNQFPDTVRVHYPYLIVVQPETRSSKIYNLETKKVEKEVKNDIPLDYLKGDTLYNWHGVTTFYNSKNLGLRCDKGFIKSVNEILCVIPKAKDPLDNKLISIDPQTGKKHDLYSSQNLITAVSFSNGQLYIGEVNISSGETDIHVGDRTIKTVSPVNIIYQMSGNMYYASFKSPRNPKAAYYLIDLDKKAVVLQKTGKILLYTP